MSVAGGGILSSQISTPSDLFSFSHVRNATRLDDARLGALRTVSSSSRGMTATVDEQVNTWRRQAAAADSSGPQDPDPEQTAGVAPHPRIGIGLPMSNIFATLVPHYTILTFRTHLRQTTTDTSEARWSLLAWTDMVRLFIRPWSSVPGFLTPSTARYGRIPTPAQTCTL